ncbi:hypothetical protein EDD16DRAFT_1728795, partial [Pisolithus croceorrhizus]
MHFPAQRRGRREDGREVPQAKRTRFERERRTQQKASRCPSTILTQVVIGCNARMERPPCLSCEKTLVKQSTSWQCLKECQMPLARAHRYNLSISKGDMCRCGDAACNHDTYDGSPTNAKAEALAHPRIIISFVDSFPALNNNLLQIRLVNYDRLQVSDYGYTKCTAYRLGVGAKHVE